MSAVRSVPSDAVSVTTGLRRLILVVVEYVLLYARRLREIRWSLLMRLNGLILLSQILLV